VLLAVAGALGGGGAARAQEAGAGAAGRARAGGALGLVVHAPPGSPAGGEALGAAVARAAAADGWSVDRRPMSRAARALASGAVPRERRERLARVRRLLAEGWRAYLEARATTAASRLGEARSEAMAVLDVDGAIELYGELSLRLGAVKLALGRDQEAAMELRLAARLAPARAVTDAEFKPAVVERAAAARAAAPPRRRLRIAVTPPGAAIELDGQPAGAGSLELEVEEGLHVVVARAAGFRARAEAVQVTGPVPGQAEAPAEVRLALDPDPVAASVASGAAALAIGRGEEAATRAGEGLLVYGELDAVALVASVWRRGAPALLGQMCRGRPARCTRVVEIGYVRARDLPAAAARLVGALAGAEVRHPLTLLVDARLVDREGPPRGGAGAGRGGAAGDRSWWRSPWLWVGVSGVALGVAAGFLLAGDDGARPAFEIDPCQFGGC